MRMHKNESPADVTRWLADRSAGRWPAILGSLSLRRSPCIRENCQACRSGEQHPSYVLYGRRKGRRFSVYIPEELVPEVRRCLDNGRALQELLYEAAARYVKALKRERQMTAEQSNDCSRRSPISSMSMKRSSRPFAAICGAASSGPILVARG